MRLFISAEQKQFLRPATGVFPVKSDALDGGRMFFLFIFSAASESRRKYGLFSQTNRTGR